MLIILGLIISYFLGFQGEPVFWTVVIVHFGGYAIIAEKWGAKGVAVYTAIDSAFWAIMSALCGLNSSKNNKKE